MFASVLYFWAVKLPQKYRQEDRLNFEIMYIQMASTNQLGRDEHFFYPKLEYDSETCFTCFNPSPDEPGYKLPLQIV